MLLILLLVLLIFQIGLLIFTKYKTPIHDIFAYTAVVDMQIQMIFDSENISGTVVGLYCPDYMDGLNTAGWHFHFISDDKQKGGHVLDVRFSQAEAVIDKTEKFKMDLPGDEMFKEADMTTDLDEAITKVEKNE